MKRVVVSQRVDAYPERQENRDALDQRLIAFLLAADCLPIPIPNSFFLGNPAASMAFHAWIAAIHPQGIILSGGNDIGTFPERDQTEARLLDVALGLQLPVLGLCRGMQMMAVRAGTGLKSVSGHIRVRHTLAGEITASVNSYHGQALAACPVDYTILARSEDGEIEAMGHRHLPWQGWMWHPEREEHFPAPDIQRLKTLFDL